MTDPTCLEVRRSAAELALDILPESERLTLESHLDSCPACRREVEGYGRLGRELLDLIPDFEPSLGFDRKAVARMAGPPRRRKRWFVVPAVAAAGLAAALGIVAAQPGSGHYTTHTAVLRTAGGIGVGSASTEGDPAWIYMTLHGAPTTGTVTCQIRAATGGFHTVGTFVISAGNGAWGAPEPAGLDHPAQARIVDSSGRVVATGTFTG